MTMLRRLLAWAQPAYRYLQRRLGNPQWMVPVFVLYAYRRWRLLMVGWVIFTGWLIFITFYHVPLIPFYPTCRAADGSTEVISGYLDFDYGQELRLYFRPFKWSYQYNPNYGGPWPHQHAEFFISPNDALDREGHTSRATLSAAYSIWYGLSDEDRANAPEPGNTDLSECEVVKLYAMAHAQRSWDQCKHFCDPDTYR